MKVGTWNVNGIRARQAQVLEFIAREKPDVLCLQEIKASIDQLTFELRDIEGYWGHWHGGKGYSVVALLFAKSFADPWAAPQPTADTKFGAAGLVMAILGGALLPPLQGIIMDRSGTAAAFIVPAVCLAFVALYALFDLRTKRDGGPLVTEGAH